MVGVTDSPSSTAKIAILISGNGSNAEALIKASEAEDFPAACAVVVSDKPDAYGLERAKNLDVATETIDASQYDSKADFEAALHQKLTEHDVDVICLAGFMRLLSGDFVTKWENKILNIHPSLLPSFKGLNAQRQALEAGVKVTGCTVHLVTAKMDDGPILAQAAVPILLNDTEDSLKLRIQAQEHLCYPLALRLFLEPEKSGYRDATMALLSPHLKIA